VYERNQNHEHKLANQVMANTKKKRDTGMLFLRVESSTRARTHGDAALISLTLAPPAAGYRVTW
jgi:hypothetical protein